MCPSRHHPRPISAVRHVRYIAANFPFGFRLASGEFHWRLEIRASDPPWVSLQLSLQVPCAFAVPTGLIIDAFGELRDQLEEVKEDMEVSWTFLNSMELTV